MWLLEFMVPMSAIKDKRNCLSPGPNPLVYGVPLGSILGAALFTLYFQPLSHVISDHDSMNVTFTSMLMVLCSHKVHHLINFVL